jgi:hypothetical protein
MLTLTLLTACGGPDKPADDTGDTQTTDDTGTVPDETACDEAEARLGYRACVNRIPDEETFTSVTIMSSSSDQLRVGKYIVPAVADAPLPTSFLDVNTFQLHYDFLVTDRKSVV